MRVLFILLLGLTACNVLPTPFSKLAEEENDAPVNVPEDSCAGAVEEAKLPIAFPTHNKNCTFDNGINGKPTAGFFQAHIEQNAVVELPAHKELCNARLTSTSGKTIYSDALLLLWEDYVLLSSEKLATKSRLETESRTGMIWSWEKMLGAKLHMADEPYCIDAEGTCVLPKAGGYDTTNITLNPNSLKLILEKQAGKTSTSFKLITGGDGAEWEPLQDTSLSDCYHRALDFELTVTYVPATRETVPEEDGDEEEKEEEKEEASEEEAPTQ